MGGLAKKFCLKVRIRRLDEDADQFTNTSVRYFIVHGRSWRELRTTPLLCDFVPRDQSVATLMP